MNIPQTHPTVFIRELSPRKASTTRKFSPQLYIDPFIIGSSFYTYIAYVMQRRALLQMYRGEKKLEEPLEAPRKSEAQGSLILSLLERAK